MKALKKADESDTALQAASRAACLGSLRSAQGGDLWHLPYKVSINIYCHRRFYKNHKNLTLNIKWQHHCELMNKHKSETLNGVLKLGHGLLKKEHFGRHSWLCHWRLWWFSHWECWLWFKCVCDCSWLPTVLVWLQTHLILPNPSVFAFILHQHNVHWNHNHIDSTTLLCSYYVK